VETGPIGKRLTPGNFGKGVVAGAHDRHEHLGILDFAGGRIDDGEGLAAIVHEHLLAGAVLLAHRDIQLLAPLPEELTVLTVLIPFGIAFLILLPQQHESQILVGNQLVVQGVPVGLGTGKGGRTVGGWIFGAP